MALRYNRDIDRETAEILEKLPKVASVHQIAPANPLSEEGNGKAANA